MGRAVAGLLAPAALWLAGCPAEPPVADREDPVAAPDPDVVVCLQGGPFVADGSVPLAPGTVGAGGDARRVSDLRWQAHEGCERFVIDLAAEDGSPATRAGEVSAEVLRDLGVVRVSLGEVGAVDADATDATFGGPLARAANAVRAPDGRSLYVDLHLQDRAEAHVHALAEPARVLVDLRPGGGPVPAPPPAHPRVVLLEPRGGPAGYPLTVAGYARTFEANVLVRIEQRGEQVHETFTTATDYVDAWGHFSLVIEQGPVGPTQLHVGEYSARDGAWDGVMVELDMR